MRLFLFAAVLMGAFLSGHASSQAQSSTTLQITLGTWGYAGQRKDVKSDVAMLCDGKPACKFMVSVDTLSATEPKDPAPGHDKGLILGWKCGDTAHRDQFPEGKYAELTCP